jgi:adenosylhomocysteine nucleosidase
VSSIGYIVALPEEAQSLVRQRAGFDSLVSLKGGHALTVSGTGPDHARQAALRLIEQGASALLSWGCAGALDPQPQPGQLIIPERIFGADGAILPTDEEWRRRLVASLAPVLFVSGGTLAESPHLVPGPPEKQALFAATGAVAADMESAAIARAAAAAGRPFLAVRAIADSASMALPQAVIASLTPRGNAQLGKLLGYSLRHPAQFIELARLGRAFGAAMATLRQVRELAGTDACFTPPSAGGLRSRSTR